MVNLVIAFCLLVFVTVRIVNLRRCRRFGVYAFPPYGPTRYYTSVYPGYIGGNARDRRRAMRKYGRTVAIPYRPEPARFPVKWNHRQVLANLPTVKTKAKSATFPLRQQIKRAGAYLPSKAELKSRFRKAKRTA